MANDLKLLPRAERLLSGTISSSMDETQTSVDVSNPPAATELPTYWEIEPDSSTYRELVRIVGVSSNTITLERGLNNGGTGFPHASLSPYKGKITSLHFNAIADALESGYLFEDASYVLTRVSTSSFKVTASGVDRTGHYTTGRWVRINGTVVVRIVSSSYSNPDTTVIVDATTVPTPITTIELEIAKKGNTLDILTTPQINDTTGDHQYIISPSELAADRTVTLPLLTGNDEFTFNAHTQTLTNKTLSAGSALDVSASENFTYHSMARQALINGNFDVWQRGTSVALADVTVTFQADRWRDYVDKSGGTLPTLTASRQLLTSGDIPNAFYYKRLATNGAGTSLGVSSLGMLRQSIEGGVRHLCGNGKKVTVSFWARSDIANKRICPVLLQNYGSGGSPSTQEPIQGTPITLTSTWTKYTATFTTNTLVGKTFGTANDDALRLDIYYMWGTTWGNTYVQTGVTAETFVGSGNIDIAQVQLCAGDVALPFQPKSYEEETRACFRYCYVPYLGLATTIIGYGSARSTTVAGINVILPVPPRIVPTLTATAGDYQLYDGATAATDVTAIVKDDAVNMSGNLYSIKATVASGLTQFRPYVLFSDATTNRLMILEAEL